MNLEAKSQRLGVIDEERAWQTHQLALTIDIDGIKDTRLAPTKRINKVKENGNKRHARNAFLVKSPALALACYEKEYLDSDSQPLLDMSCTTFRQDKLRL